MNPVGLNPSEVGGGTGHTLMGPRDMPDCQPLAIVEQAINGQRVCISRWSPTTEERAALAAGADVLLWVWGWQPPVAVGVIASEDPS